MTSIKKIEANRENGKKGKGPITENGKYWSSQNSLKHGLTSSSALTIGENQKEYELFIEQATQHYRPFDFYSNELVSKMVEILWKLKRVSKIESGIYAYEMQTYEADEYKSKLVHEIKHKDFEENDQKKIHYQNLLMGIAFLRDSNSGNAFFKISSYEGKLLSKLFQLKKELETYKEQQHGYKKNKQH